MNYCDHTFTSPAENLACDEALLNRGEAGGAEVLRFWEPREYFVVVGYANKVEAEVEVAACAARKVPIFRRSSGGGTVLQGPGCLNYTLILQIAAHPALASIASANKFIMEHNRAAVESVIGPASRGQPAVTIRGHTDLALGERKFSGNSQRRQKRSLLFHGTFLLNFDLPLVNDLLRMPSQQPGYRNHRNHIDFLTNVKAPAARLKSELGKVWEATAGSDDFTGPETHKLAVEKYATAGWNFKL
ncbi:MAG: lipoate--protein ligase family protein [Verrucomicrobiia bacterium]